MTRGSSPTYTTGSHENRHRLEANRKARAAYLLEREARRQAAFAVAVVTWDAGCA